MPRATSRKRPCRICRRWFLPNVRLKDRQRTCGASDCQRQWHKRQCAAWNRKNAEYFKAIYLTSKLEQITRSPPAKPAGCDDGQPQSTCLPNTRIKLGLPQVEIQEVITAQQLVIIEYIVEQILQRYRVAMRSQFVTPVGKAAAKYP